MNFEDILKNLHLTFESKGTCNPMELWVQGVLASVYWKFKVRSEIKCEENFGSHQHTLHNLTCTIISINKT